MDKLISVIILNWNGKHHLDECLGSVLNQTYNNYEVILVDNRSTDGSQEYIKEKFPSVSLVCLDRNYGFCKGNNEGIKAAKGDFIVLLNNDTMVEKDWLENLYRCITSDPEVGFCASKMVSYYKRDLIDGAGDGFSVCGAGFKRGHLEDLSGYSEDEYVFGASGGAVMYKRELLDKVGLLDEDFFAIYEDADLSFRAQLAGYKCKLASDAVVYHKVNSTLGKLSDFYVYHGHRNVEYAYFKNMPNGLIARTLLQHMAYNLLAFGYFILKGKALVFIKAKIHFLKDINKVKNKRRHIQKTKVVSNAYIWSLLDMNWLTTRLKGK